LYLWNGAGFEVIQYYVGAGWYDVNLNLVTNSITPGFGAFLQNGSGGSATITVVGQVPQGGFTNVVALGLGFYSLPSSIATNIDSSIMNFPAAQDDLYYHYNVAGQGFDNPFQYYDGFGWADINLTQVFPTPNVGEGFLIQHSGGASNWIANFTVQ
jgi:hypothetical protein